MTRLSLDAEDYSSPERIEELLINAIAAAVGEPAECFSLHTSMHDIGLDSVELEMMLADLEAWRGQSLDRARVMDCQTLGDFAALLAHKSEPPRNSGVVPSGTLATSRFERYVNPHLGLRLRALRLDKHFTKGSGSVLYDDEGLPYLDFVAGYGCVPFGHSPAEIWSAITEVRDRSEPIFVQPANLEPAALVAEQLLALAPRGLRHVTFVNSGAEAAEAAIKLVRVATGKLGILSMRGGYHGKTLGALSATAKEDYQRGFGAPLPHFHHVEFGDIDALEHAISERQGALAGFIVEPTQGEGGMRVTPPGYLRAASELCRKAGVLMIVDEVQTGLGRSGHMFACDYEDIQPDVLLLAKALGGGVCPVGAVLCNDAAYTERFALKHSSTFAGNTLCMRVASRVLELLQRNDRAIVRNAHDRGEQLREGLLELKRAYPSLIEEVRGRGLMLGIRLRGHDAAQCNSFSEVAQSQGQYAALVASYLLNVESLRVVPTLNGSDVIRIEPPLTVTASECAAALERLNRCFSVLAHQETGALLAGVLRGRDFVPAEEPRRDAPVAPDESRGSRIVMTNGDLRFGFLVHALDAFQFCDFDPSLSVLQAHELEEVARDVGDLLEPFVGASVCFTSPTGARAVGDFIVVPRTAETLSAMSEREAIQEVGAAIDLAVRRGARLVGLGGYTSSVTRGGTTVTDRGVGITSGNAYTAVSALDALQLASGVRGLALATTTAAVIGAGGSVGRAAALLVSEISGRLFLVGNPARTDAATEQRMLEVAMDLCNHALGLDPEKLMPGSLAHFVQTRAAHTSTASLVDELVANGRIIATRFAETVLPLCHLVVVATNSPSTILAPDSFKTGAIVCDLSRPANVSETTALLRPDIMVIDGGLIRAPMPVDLRRFGLPTDHVYACMAETAMLALAGNTHHFALGANLPLETIASARTLAGRHGFHVGRLRSFGRLISTETFPTAHPNYSSSFAERRAANV